MRISGGRLKNRAVKVLDRPGLRPTSSRVREAVFHRIQADLVDATVWDAFGGSGILSFEAWSRGASEVVCTEQDRRAARQITAAARELGAPLQVVQSDARRFKGGLFDVILADPPYADSPSTWLPILSVHLKPYGLLVFEHRTGTLSTGRHAGLRVSWQRRYGDTTVSFLEHAELDSGHKQGPLTA